VVLVRIVVLRVSTGCLNTGSCSVHMVATRKTRVIGWCKGELLFSVIQVGVCVTGSWCWNTQGVGASF
jgi:hypothetical protein